MIGSNNQIINLTIHSY